jgi:hypothetical protein
MDAAKMLHLCEVENTLIMVLNDPFRPIPYPWNMTMRLLALAIAFATPLLNACAQDVRTQVHTGDVTNFWTAFDLIQATRDTSE